MQKKKRNTTEICDVEKQAGLGCPVNGGHRRQRETEKQRGGETERQTGGEEGRTSDQPPSKMASPEENE